MQHTANDLVGRLIQYTKYLPTYGVITRYDEIQHLYHILWYDSGDEASYSVSFTVQCLANMRETLDAKQQ